jgi:hypothetical protein
MTQVDTRSADTMIMEIFRINILPQMEIEKRQAFIKSQHHCPICETELTMRHQACEFTNSMLEVARCASCDLKIRSKSFELQ